MRTVILTLGVVALFAAQSSAATIPTVTSGTLIAHFQAGPNVATDGGGLVTSWTAENDNSIVLTTQVTLGTNTISYNATGMGGSPTVEVNDPSGNEAALLGDIGLGSALTNSTIFWLGYHDPGRTYSGGTSIGDGSGQYAYGLGADGAEGSQMDAQIDDGNFEFFGGSGTQTGDSISSRNGTYTVWRNEYYDNVITDPGHAAYADGTNLNVAANGAGYSVPAGSDLLLFAYQNSGGTGSSGFNFVGNMSELIIFEGNLDSTDIAAVQSYLTARIPEPSTVALAIIGLIGCVGFRCRR